MAIFSTLPKSNIAPENKSSQKESSIPTIHFQVRAVSFREGMYLIMLDFWSVYKMKWRIKQPKDRDAAWMQLQPATPSLGFPMLPPKKSWKNPTEFGRIWGTSWTTDSGHPQPKKKVYPWKVTR